MFHKKKSKLKESPNTFDNHVVSNIIVNNRFGITQVKNIENIKSIYFLSEEYSNIEKLIESKDVQAIKLYQEDQPQTEEYLDIILFEDQSKNKYVAAIYDSIRLEQDPQIIEIYLL